MLYVTQNWIRAPKPWEIERLIQDPQLQQLLNVAFYECYRADNRSQGSRLRELKIRIRNTITKQTRCV